MLFRFTLREFLSSSLEKTFVGNNYMHVVQIQSRSRVLVFPQDDDDTVYSSDQAGTDMLDFLQHFMQGESYICPYVKDIHVDPFSHAPL